jgi:hypothetical protein
MTDTIIHAARALWLLLTRGPRLALLHFELWELRAWVADIREDFARNGLADSQHLRECRAREQELTVQIALLQPAGPGETA